MLHGISRGGGAMGKSVRFVCGGTCYVMNSDHERHKFIKTGSCSSNDKRLTTGVKVTGPRADMTIVQFCAQQMWHS